jgi:hypothetical protein
MPGLARLGTSLLRCLASHVCSAEPFESHPMTDAFLDYAASRKASIFGRPAEGVAQLSEKETAQLQAELAAAVSSLGNAAHAADPPAETTVEILRSQSAKDPTDRRTANLNGDNRNAKEADGVQEKLSSGNRESQKEAKPSSDGTGVQRQTVPSINAQKQTEQALLPKSQKPSAQPSKETEVQQGTGNAVSETDAQKTCSDAAVSPNRMSRSISQLSAILQGTRLQELSEEHERALKRARDDPKDLEALQQAAVSFALGRFLKVAFSTSVKKKNSILVITQAPVDMSCRFGGHGSGISRLEV